MLNSQNHFIGFAIAKAMSDTGAISVAKAFKECVFCRFGDPSLILHDRDPIFISKMFVHYVGLRRRSEAERAEGPKGRRRETGGSRAEDTSPQVGRFESD